MDVPVLECENSSQLTREVTTPDLPAMFAANKQQTQILSLDCFDTLIWRKCARPTDVFYTLQHAPLFKKLNFHPTLRINAEQNARRRKSVETGSNEVTLRDIYLAAYPNLSDEEIEQLSREEVECEINYCFAYQPVVELLQSAIDAGKKIIIVSDTYLSSAQLKQILDACLAKEIVQAITHLFTSNEIGMSKSEGIFAKLVPKLELQAESILHLGDHPIADYQVPLQSGINAYNFIHYSEYIQQIARMQNLMALILEPNIRTERPLYNPYKLIYALATGPFTTINTNLQHSLPNPAVGTSLQEEAQKPETCIGYYVLGPILHAFSAYLIDEYHKLNAQHPNLKVAFLLRDGYLPWLATQTLFTKPLGEQVRISRFAAYAASFRSKEDIRDYVASVIEGARYKDICKQLLLKKVIIDELVEKTNHAKNPSAYFTEQILKPHMVNRIIKASKLYWQRLRKYLEKSLALKAGDTLLLVDLGYSCTTQRQLEPILRDEMNITLIGRYLLSLRTADWQENRSGLIDASWCDDNTMLMVVGYIAILEQLCTTVDKSVVDFDENGNPIYMDTSLNADQHTKLVKVQEECIRFIQDIMSNCPDFYQTINLDWLRSTALASLSRFIFLPTSIEVDYLQTFKFDLNLGTEDTFKVFDPMLGLAALRQRGLFFMERSSKNMRTNYPAELRYAGIELALTLISQHRFNLEFSVNDMSLRKEHLQVVVIHPQATSQYTLAAQPTFDGYFSLIIPIGSGNYNIGVLLGAKYKWLQIESISLIHFSVLYSDSESIYTEDASKFAILDKVKKHDGNLYECDSNLSLLFLQSPPIQSNKHYVFRVVYRPIV